MKLKETINRLRMKFGKKYRASVCGHTTKLVVEINAFGEKIFFILNKKRLDYCAECLEKMSIRCAWCGKSIIIGDPVTLYTPRKKDFQIPSHAVVFNEDPLQLVGCLRWDCADTGADRMGFWIPPGKVHRVVSPIEMAIATNETVIAGDLTDIKKAVPYSNQ